MPLPSRRAPATDRARAALADDLSGLPGSETDGVLRLRPR